MMFVAAVLAGLALGALVPAADSVSLRGVRIAALLVVMLAATAAWPIISPDNSWPSLTFGLTAVCSALLISWSERRALRKSDAAEQAAA